jgi:hypothetical protein
MYLLNSINLQQSQETNPFMTENTSGTELWMRIVGTVQSFKIKQLTKVEYLIQITKLKDFTGENIKDYGKKMMGYCNDWKQQDNFLNAGVTSSSRT